MQSQICTSYCNNMLLTIAQHLHGEGLQGTMLCCLLKLNIKFLEWRKKKLKKWGLSFHCLLVLNVVYSINDSKKNRHFKQKALYCIIAVVQMFSVFTSCNINTLHCNSHQRSDYYIQNALEVAFDCFIFSINTCNVCIYKSTPFTFNHACQKELQGFSILLSHKHH